MYTHHIYGDPYRSVQRFGAEIYFCAIVKTSWLSSMSETIVITSEYGTRSPQSRKLGWKTTYEGRK